jgi:hypothetical protein
MEHQACSYEMDARHLSQSMTAQPAPSRGHELMLIKNMLSNQQLGPVESLPTFQVRLSLLWGPHRPHFRSYEPSPPFPHPSSLFHHRPIFEHIQSIFNQNSIDKKSSLKCLANRIPAPLATASPPIQSLAVAQTARYIPPIQLHPYNMFKLIYEICRATATILVLSQGAAPTTTATQVNHSSPTMKRKKGEANLVQTAPTTTEIPITLRTTIPAVEAAVVRLTLLPTGMCIRSRVA